MRSSNTTLPTQEAELGKHNTLGEPHLSYHPPPCDPGLWPRRRIYSRSHRVCVISKPPPKSKKIPPTPTNSRLSSPCICHASHFMGKLLSAQQRRGRHGKVFFPLRTSPSLPMLSWYLDDANASAGVGVFRATRASLGGQSKVTRHTSPAFTTRCVHRRDLAWVVYLDVPNKPSLPHAPFSVQNLLRGCEVLAASRLQSFHSIHSHAQPHGK